MKAFQIEDCRGDKGCPNSLCPSSKLIEKIDKIAQDMEIETFILKKVGEHLMGHNVFRVGIANCPNACSQVQIKDFGIIVKVKININLDECTLCGKCVKACFERALSIADNKINFNFNRCIGCGVCSKVCENNCINISEYGYQIFAGGKLGRHPRLAVEITPFAKESETLAIFEKILKFYKDNNIAGERVGAIFDRVKPDISSFNSHN